MAGSAEKQKLSIFGHIFDFVYLLWKKLMKKGFYLPINQQTLFGKFYNVKITMFKQQTILIGRNLSSPGVERCSLTQKPLCLILTLQLSWPFRNIIPI